MKSHYRVLLFVAFFALAAGCSADGSPSTPTRNNAEEMDMGDTDENDANNTVNHQNNEADMNIDPPDMPMGTCQVDGCEQGLVCNTSNGLCQACEFDEECGEDATCDRGQCVCDRGFHFCGDTCVDSSAVETCGNRCEVCPTPTGGEAACESEVCTGTCRGNSVYDADANACVGCVMNDDCTDRLNSVCDNGACTGCTDNSGCSHLADTPVCDTDVSRCVECVGDDDCGGNSCNLVTGECTQTAVGSLTNCEACEANSECPSGFECVPMFFDGQVRNSAYCLGVKSGDCPDPGFATEITRPNISSTSESTYCGINESLATCEAVLDYSNPCSTNADCGAPGLDDGYCTENLEFEPVVGCSYECSSTNECTSGITGFVVCMGGDQGVSVCGGV